MAERKFRLAVGAPNGPQSAVWLIWTGARTSDVYIACRHIAAALKVSLHASGNWRLAFTARFAAERLPPGGAVSDRAEEKWTRPPEARRGWTHAFTIIVPAGELWQPQPPLPLPSQVIWRRPPAANSETHFGVFLERPPAARRPGGDVLGQAVLPNGERLWIIAADFATLPENAATYARSRKSFRRRTPGATDYGVRGLIFGDRPDGARVAIDLHIGARTPPR